MTEQLELHRAWPRLSDDQRVAINEVWNDLVEPALERGDAADRRMQDARLVEQDARAFFHYLRDEAGFAALHMPVHDAAYGCCLHGTDVGDFCACRVRGERARKLTPTSEMVA